MKMTTKIKTAKRPKSRPFKKWYCDRNETFLLPPIAFKIWMYHYTREGEDRKSWPAVKKVMAACGITRDITFYKWRAYLKTNGWLERVGEVPSKHKGGRPVPIFRVTRGTIPSAANTAKIDVNPITAKSDANPARLTAQSDGNPTASDAVNPTARNAVRSRTTEVEPLEVDSKTLKPEVDGPVQGFSSGQKSKDSPAYARAKELINQGGAR